MKLSAVVITKNEETNIEACLRSLAFADEIVVVDSGSSDRTRDISRQYTDKIYVRPFDDFSSQKNFAITQASGEWILSVDADERVSGPLKKQIESLLANEANVVAYRIPRQTFFLGKPFRFSGTQDDKPIRLFRRDTGRFVQPIHEFFDTAGPVAVLRESLLHYTTRTIQEEVEKTSFYTELEARFLIDKKQLVGRMERELRGVAIFCYHYFWKLGFLDGWEGFLYAFYARRYTRIKYKKLRQAEAAK